MRVEVTTRLVGAFNVANTLTALGIGLGLGLDLEQMLAALGEFRGVPGRMEPVDAGQDFAVLVDYAHTPDSVAQRPCGRPVGSPRGGSSPSWAAAATATRASVL